MSILKRRADGDDDSHAGLASAMPHKLPSHIRILTTRSNVRVYKCMYSSTVYQYCINRGQRAGRGCEAEAWVEEAAVEALPPRDDDDAAVGSNADPDRDAAAHGTHQAKTQGPLVAVFAI